MLDALRDQRVSRLVEGHDAFLVLVDQAVLLLQPGDDSVGCPVDVPHRHRVGTETRGKQRSLVEQVGQVGADKAGSTARYDVEIDFRRELDLASMDFQDGQTAVLAGTS